MEVEDQANSSGRTSDSEVYVQDINDEDLCYTFGDMPKLQFRKGISKSRWSNEMGMAEVVEKKGGLWTTTGIVRNSKTYCFIEEALYLAEVGALHLLDNDDTPFSLKVIYNKVAEGKYGCCWESFEVYRNLKSLGYIVRRHYVPWTIKSVKSKSVSLQSTSEFSGMIDKESEDKRSIVELFNDMDINMKINELRPAFDVYPPNSKFKKTFPGNPDFVLCLTSGHPPSKLEIEVLQKWCNNIPLKFCHVEHGRVSFFSFNRVELPVLP